jgi:putative tricarboxylic transport membrane protein
MLPRKASLCLPTAKGDEYAPAGDHDDHRRNFRALPRGRGMSRPTRIGQDVGAGLMFIAIGALGLYLARNYPVGTALRMEPGYVPRLLCWGIIGVGAITAARGLLAGDAPLARWHWRPLVFVLGGLMAFRYLIEPGGLIAATIITVVLAAIGSREVKMTDTLLLAAGLAAAAVALFIVALGLPMRMLPF